MKQLSKKVMCRAAILLLLLDLMVSVTIPSAALIFSNTADNGPKVSDLSKVGVVGEVVSFSANDFVVEAGNDVQLDSVEITTLPNENAGVLKVGDQELGTGDIIAMTAVNGLRFYPAAVDKEIIATFTFLPVFDAGKGTEEVIVSIHLMAGENKAPTAENLTYKTYKNVAITGRFGAVDPEGDLITFQLMEKPARGSINLSKDQTGEFVYTPYENKTGKDFFTYVAVDAKGNMSKPATVNIRIEKSPTKITYADMDGHAAYRAALKLAGEGIFIGENMAGKYFFQPELPVSRSEFLAMALTATGVDKLSTVTQTGFYDDQDIPVWAKPYVSTALKSGVIRGMVSESGQIVFKAQSTVTRAEAAVILNKLLEIADVATSAMYTDQDSAPAWAYQAAVNLESCGVILTDHTGALALSNPLSRADTAEMLCSAVELLEARKDTGWFIW